MRYGLIVTSNGYRDRDGEYVTTKALAEHVERSWDGNEYVGGGEFYFYHHDGVSIGRIVACALVDGFLIELVEEGDSPIARLIWDIWQATPDLVWGASQGFYSHAVSDTFHSISKDETSLLLASDASNPYTLAVVI